MPDRENDEQGNTWALLYQRVCDVLSLFGTENAFGEGDYWVLDDNYGWRETHVEIHNLKMLEPAIVAQLRALAAKAPNWQVSIAVHVPETKPGWPAMGLIIRSHEIIDGLQRQYLPEPYRSFRYEGGRPGTEND